MFPQCIDDAMDVYAVLLALGGRLRYSPHEGDS